MNHTHTINDTESHIPFVQIISPYVGNFGNITELKISDFLKKKLQNQILEDLSSYAEVTLQSALDHFVQNGGSSFGSFVENISNTLSQDYPVLHEKLKTKVVLFSHHISKIFSRFQNDSESIIETFKLNTSAQNLKIYDIEASVGDGHNGDSTALIYLSEGTKLIYKPRNLDITHSYNAFINWVNSNSNVDLKTFKILNCENYGWLEFIQHQEVHSEIDLREYYYKAGALLAITLFLGSKDYHRENIIAAGKNPVLIDHETIIQPFLHNDSVRSWDEENKIPYFSVLESALIINSGSEVPSNCAGFGISGQLEANEIEKKVIHPNTINSKRATRFITRKLVENNVPVYKGYHVFADQYKENFKNGFSDTYDLFLQSKQKLKDENSPLKLFKDKEIRYVWRPTFVYFKILKFLRNPVFMSDTEEYQTKLYNLLSKAYKGEHMDEYRFILNFEMKQMLNGDIPIFSLKSTENFLEGNTGFRIFKHNCLEDIENRINLLSEKHKKEQLNHIEQWLHF